MKKFSRRSFLEKSGFAAAGIFSSPTILNSRRSEQKVIDLGENQKSIQQEEFSKPLTCLIIGAGNRGWNYSRYAKKFPEQMKVIGIAEPVKLRQQKFIADLELDEENVFDTWEDAFKKPKMTDFVVISTWDKFHYPSAMKAIEMGYHVLLEKAIAQSWEECKDILEHAEKFNRIVGICHVLRYSPYFIKMRDIVQSGEIGEVVSMQHLEPIDNIHFSHSFVRGNWGNEKESTPCLLSKSCHDLDIIYWILGKKCKQVTSFGDLNYFKTSNAPMGSTLYCIGGCAIERSCPYSSKRIYHDKREFGVRHVIDLQDWDSDKVLKAIKDGPYGRCVFYCDNDVVDHQIVNMQFEDNATVAFSMEAHTNYGGRKTRIMGTKGDIVGDEKHMAVFNFQTRKETVYKSSALNADFSGGGHGGGDHRLVRDFLNSVYNEDESLLTSTIKDSMESHYIGFKAEESRKSGGRVLDL